MSTKELPQPRPESPPALPPEAVAVDATALHHRNGAGPDALTPPKEKVVDLLRVKDEKETARLKQESQDLDVQFEQVENSLIEALKIVAQMANEQYAGTDEQYEELQKTVSSILDSQALIDEADESLEKAAEKQGMSSENLTERRKKFAALQDLLLEAEQLKQKVETEWIPLAVTEGDATVPPAPSEPPAGEQRDTPKKKKKSRGKGGGSGDGGGEDSQNQGQGSSLSDAAKAALLRAKSEARPAPREPVPPSAEPKAGENQDETDRDAEPRSYASFSQSELREMWRNFSHEEMLSAVESQVADWEGFDERIRKFGDEARLLDDIRAAETEEDPEEVIRLIGRTRSIAAALRDIRKRFEENGRLDKKDAGTLTALLHPYHELLVAAERLTEERERETPIIAAEQEAAKRKRDEKESHEPSFVAQLDALTAKIEEWRTLRKELLALIGDKQYETFINKSGAVGALARGSVLKEVEAKIAELRENVQTGERVGKRERNWIAHHFEGIQAIIAIGTKKRDQLLRTKPETKVGSGEGAEVLKGKETDPSFEMHEGDVWVREKDGKVERMTLGAVEGEKIQFTYATQAGDASASLPMKGKAHIEKLQVRLETEGYQLERKRKRAAKKVSAEPAADAVANVDQGRIVTKDTDAPIEAAEFDRALAEASELVARWEVLGEQVGFGPLRKGIRQLNGKGFKFPPVTGTRNWLKEKKTSPDWSEEDRRVLVERAWPDLKQLLAQAETVAAQLSVSRAESQPATPEVGTIKAEVSPVSTETEAHDEESLEDALGRGLRLVRRWDTIARQCGGRDELLKRISELRGTNDLPVVVAIKNWLVSNGVPRLWPSEEVEARKEAFYERLLPDLEGLVRDAEQIAETLKQGREAQRGSAGEKKEGDEHVPDATEKWLNRLRMQIESWRGGDAKDDPAKKLVTAVKGTVKDHVKLVDSMTRYFEVGDKALPDELADIVGDEKAVYLKLYLRKLRKELQAAVEELGLGDKKKPSEEKQEQLLAHIHEYAKNCRDLRRPLLPEIHTEEFRELTQQFNTAYHDFLIEADQRVGGGEIQELSDRVHDIHAEYLARLEEFKEEKPVVSSTLSKRDTYADAKAEKWMKGFGTPTPLLEIERDLLSRPGAEKKFEDLRSDIQEMIEEILESQKKLRAVRVKKQGSESQPTPRFFPFWKELDEKGKKAVNEKLYRMKDDFKNGLNDQLKSAGISDQAVRLRVIIPALQDYLSSQLSKPEVVGAQLDDTEIAKRMIELMKEVVVS